MSLNWFALFPEFFLVLTLVGSVFVRLFREKATPKTFYTLSKFGAVAAFIATLIFYNQSFWNGVYENSLHSSLFKVFIYQYNLICHSKVAEKRSCSPFAIPSRVDKHRQSFTALATSCIMLSATFLPII